MVPYELLNLANHDETLTFNGGNGSFKLARLNFVLLSCQIEDKFTSNVPVAIKWAKNVMRYKVGFDKMHYGWKFLHTDIGIF
uniref:Uncharacterized protein n=1 Tax=Romanomermis culicivorax TaxID=13658 RepID=A0A915J3A3_ROMCU